MTRNGNVFAFAASADPIAWGTLGTLNENTLASILRLAGHSTVRCINKNGRALANSTMNAERDDRAKTVQHSSDDWKAWNVIHGIVQGLPTDNPIPIIVNANSDILITMARAAFGQLVIGGIDNMGSALDETDECYRVLVFRNVIILMGYLYDELPRLDITPYYELNYAFDISAISQSMHQRIGGDNPEKLAMHTILQILDLCLYYKGGNVIQVQHFKTSVGNILPANSMHAILSENDLILLTDGYIPSKVYAAYVHAKCSVSGYVVGINDAIRHPDWTHMFSAILWKDGPAFCVVDNGTYAFRSTDFPKIGDDLRKIA